MNKPQIFQYHSYQTFLKDQLLFLKHSYQGYSGAAIAKKIAISPTLLSLFLSGQRHPTKVVFARLINALHLSGEEKKFFELLYQIGTAKTLEEQSTYANQLSAFPHYRNLNAEEVQTYNYLTKWYYIAIREMVDLPEFKMDTLWIKKQLNFPVSTETVEEALRFLIENKFIIKKAGDKNKSKYENTGKEIAGTGSTYRMALREYHRQFLKLSQESMDAVPTPERFIKGYTFSFSQGEFEKIKEVLDETIQKLKKIYASKGSSDSVYHVEIAALPLVQLRDGRPKG